MIPWGSVVSPAVYGMHATRAPVPTHLILKIKKNGTKEIGLKPGDSYVRYWTDLAILFGTKALPEPITNACLLSVGPLWLYFSEILNKIHIYGMLVPDEVLDLQCITLQENHATYNPYMRQWFESSSAFRSKELLCINNLRQNHQ